VKRPWNSVQFYRQIKRNSILMNVERNILSWEDSMHKLKRTVFLSIQCTWAMNLVECTRINLINKTPKRCAASKARGWSLGTELKEKHESLTSLK
jgi:hypothetical protein